MSAGIDRSHLQADAPHRSVGTELLLRQLFLALERRHGGLIKEVADGVNEELARITLDTEHESDFAEKMKAAMQAVLQRPLI